MTGDFFEKGQRMARMLSESSLVPKQYQSNIPNTMIALELSNRIGISPFMTMQNLHIIDGKPSWGSSFVIAAINSCGRFTPLKFKFVGEKGQDEYGCYAVATEKKTGEDLIGPTVDMKMVKAEGWLSRKGSKWVTMPEVMFRYRAATFFGRIYSPDILQGMHSADEVKDIDYTEVPTKEEHATQEHQNRVRKWIEKAKSVDELKGVEFEKKDEETQKLYDERLNLLLDNEAGGE